MIPYLTATEGELLQLDRTRRAALQYRSGHPQGSPQLISRRLSAIVRRAWALAF